MEKWKWDLLTDRTPSSFNICVRAFRIELGFGSVSFCGEGKTAGIPGEKPLGAKREPTTNSTYMWSWDRESNPGHIGRRRILSPLCHHWAPPLGATTGRHHCAIPAPPLPMEMLLHWPSIGVEGSWFWAPDTIFYSVAFWRIRGERPSNSIRFITRSDFLSNDYEMKHQSGKLLDIKMNQTKEHFLLPF